MISSAPISLRPALSFFVFFALAASLIGGTAEGPAAAPAQKASSGPAAPAASTARLANVSTRLPVGTGNDVLIAGFTVSGAQPKKIIVRGLGPLLPVIANLSDPTLELHDSFGTTLAGNDNWRDTQEQELKATTIPPNSDYDAAIVRSPTPGAYTAVLAGKGLTTGVGLVEVYDLDLAADSRLVNVSTRGRVDQGDDVLICGTIVVGSGSTTVIFRALGPSLLQFGVSNALVDPILELHNGQGATIATNDNWEDTQKAAIEATSIAPSDPREAAILRDLTPGNYTAVVKGKNNTTGVAVVDAYQLN